MAAAVTSLWPETVTLAEVARGAAHRRLAADDTLRKRLAKALGLSSLDRLEAEVTVKPWLDGAEVQGRWRAAIVQPCGVTLEPLSTELEGDFVVHVVPRGSDAAPQEGAEVELRLDDDDPPDLLEGDRIDVGHYVVEHLALEIDPFPRAPGAQFDPPPAEEPPSPFSILGRLKTDDPGG